MTTYSANPISYPTNHTSTPTNKTPFIHITPTLPNAAPTESYYYYGMSLLNLTFFNNNLRRICEAARFSQLNACVHKLSSLFFAVLLYQPVLMQGVTKIVRLLQPWQQLSAKLQGDWPAERLIPQAHQKYGLTFAPTRVIVG